jgi:quercetin dioxygenase-like cupin family protein
MKRFFRTGFLFAIGPMLTAALFAVDSAPARLGTSLFKWEDLPAKPTEVGERRDVADQPTATLERFECHISTLLPGRLSHPPHRHPQEEFILLREGTLDVAINGKVQRAGPGAVLFFASNDLHNVTNVGDKPAVYFVFNLTTAATHSVPAQPAVESASPDRLRSAVFDWPALQAKPTKLGERRDIFDSPTVTCRRLEAHAMTLGAGGSRQPLHRHPQEAVVVVKEGMIEATADGKVRQAGPGAILFLAPNDEHGIRNAGTVPATYYVFEITTEATPAPTSG